MLMDILGILIGFASIMLLFSLLVTAIVHGIQTFFSLRLKNLKKVLITFLKQVDYLDASQLNALIADMDRRAPDQLFATAFPLKLSVNKVQLSNIGLDEFKHIINNCKGLTLEEREQLCHKVDYYFSTLESIMRQRFTQWMHQLSIITAFVLCFLFQVNCFQLLSDLNNDSYYRKQLNMTAQQLLRQPAPKPADEYEANEQPVIPTQLMSLNFEVQPEQWQDYYASWKAKTLLNWLGLVFSTILISLGAPFWYNRLKDVMSWRDRLAPK